MKKQARAVCKTCLKSDIKPQQIALLKLNGDFFSFKCLAKDRLFNSSLARFNRKNCGDYKGPGSGKEEY